MADRTSIVRAPYSGRSAVVDVVVVGAGLSGLRAATDIQKAGLSCIVLEADGRVGGKTYSAPAYPGSAGKVELGGAWVNDTTQSYMYAMAKEFGLDLEVQRVEGITIYETQDLALSKFTGQDSPGTHDEHQAADAFVSLLNRLAEESDLEDPSAGPNAAELDHISLEDFTRRHSDSPAVADIAKFLAKGAFGLEAREISTLFLLNFIKSGGGLIDMISQEKGGANYMRVKQGTQSFSTCMAERLRPGSVCLFAPVTHITQNKSEGCVVETSTGITVKCKKVVVSIPTPLYSTISFSPRLPPSKIQLSENTVLGYYSKMILVYSEPWWRKAGLSGTLSSTAEGPISFTRDTCVEGKLGQFSITCFMVGATGRTWSLLPKAARRTAVLDHYKRMMAAHVKPEEIPEPINILEIQWMSEPWSRGAPSPAMGTCLLTSDAGKSMTTPHKNVHFVGTETSKVWKTFMEGAVRSGERGAQEVIQALLPGKAGGKVNAML